MHAQLSTQAVWMWIMWSLPSAEPCFPGQMWGCPQPITRGQSRIAGQWEPVESGDTRVSGRRGFARFKVLPVVFGCGHSGFPGILCGMRGDTRRPTEQPGITLSLVPQPIRPLEQLRCNICSYAPSPLTQPLSSGLTPRHSLLASTKRCVCYQPMLHTPPGRLPTVSRRLAVHIP